MSIHALAHPLPFVLLLALVWGAVWAAVLELTRFGAWLTNRRTWLAVVIGVGADVLILAIVLAPAAWLAVLAVFAASSVGIILRSLINEMRREATLISGYDKEPPREPRYTLKVEPAHRGEPAGQDEAHPARD